MDTAAAVAYLLARDVVVRELDLAHASRAQRLAQRIVSQNPGPTACFARRAAFGATVTTIIVPLITVRARRRRVRLRWHRHRTWLLGC